MSNFEFLVSVGTARINKLNADLASLGCFVKLGHFIYKDTYFVHKMVSPVVLNLGYAYVSSE